jgi:hypothetical protein
LYWSIKIKIFIKDWWLQIKFICFINYDTYMSWSMPMVFDEWFHQEWRPCIMPGFFPPISLLNISVYRIQPRLFIDSPLMTLICLDPCQWSLMSLITGNKVKKNTQAKVLWKIKGQSQQKNFEKFKLWYTTFVQKKCSNKNDSREDIY